MSKIHSSVTELPLSCKSATERAARELSREDSFADLTDSCYQKLTELEQVISKETGEKVALVAYRM